MTARGFYTLLFGALMLFTALSVGSGGAFVLGCAALIAAALSLISVLCARFSFRIRQHTDGNQAVRGGMCAYVLSVRLFTPLPIAPLSLEVTLPSGRQSEFLLPARMIGTTDSVNEFSCPHVGVFAVGASCVTFMDCFGLFSLRARIAQDIVPVTILPNPREVAPVRCSPGEGETSAAQRAQADCTTPEDTRIWQEGDELGRIHWKLSMRRQQLMVHTYETPQRPDALVLLDCAAPDCADRDRAAVIDALLETCAGVLKSLLDSCRITRLPLSGRAQRELNGQAPEALDPMLHAIAQEPFDRVQDFSRVLLLASRRMRRTGSTVILTTRLTPVLADAVIALNRMGPHTRFILITAQGVTDQQDKLIRLLTASGVETEHVQAKEGKP